MTEDVPGAKRSLPMDHRAPIAVVAASLAMLAGALFFQYGMNLPPCALCIWQRWAYAPPIVLGLLALAIPKARRPLIILAGLSFLAGSGIAGFHAGVEKGWWEGLSSCTGAATNATTIEGLRAQLMAAAPVRCDEVAWSFAGISMAGWNMIAQIAFAIFAFRSAGRHA